MTIKVLFFADTHLGFDYPLRPLVERRRRGQDFFDNYGVVLDFAETHDVDLVVHGGDLFFRSLVPETVVSKAYQRLHEFARSKIPLYVVPGNHERSKLPQSLFVAHSCIHIFHSTVTFHLDLKGAHIALSGFPSFRGKIRTEFSRLAARFNEEAKSADIRLLCMHEVVEGAKVGPSDYTFRSGDHVIKMKDIPAGFHAILSGHIHRAQILRCIERDGQGRDAGDMVPVIYPGSTERTSFAEKDEVKGFYLITFERSLKKWSLTRTEFIELKTRPMVNLNIPQKFQDRETLLEEIRGRVLQIDQDAIVRLVISDDAAAKMVTASLLRDVAPPSMNIELRLPQTAEISRKKKLGDKLRELPAGPGVYMFLDRAGRVFYVGKSKNLKSRVKSYFSGPQYGERFRRKLAIEDVKFHSTATELLALLLEDRLIKKYLPELNTRQKEFSGYCYLALTEDLFPTFLTVDSPEECTDGEIFGPFGDQFFSRDLREMICSSFRIRYCKDREPQGRCVRFSAGLCLGACFDPSGREEYLSMIEKARAFLHGDSTWLESTLQARMASVSDNLQYESAARIRESIRFVKGFCERQRFVARFRDEGLVIRERGDCEMTYLFRQGALVRIYRQFIDPDTASRTLSGIENRKAVDNPGHVLDRAMIVCRFICRDDIKTEHYFVPLQG